MIEFEITAVFKANPGDFTNVADCLASLGNRANEIMAPYGGRVINMDCKSHMVESPNGKEFTVTDHLVLVMKASGGLQP